MKGAGRDEQDVVGLYRAIFGGDGGAFDERQQVALHAFAADRTAAHVADGDLVDLVEKNDAIGFGAAHRLAGDILVIEAFVRFFGDQRLEGGFHSHLAALGAPAHRFAEHVRQVDHADLAGLHAGHFEVRRALGYFNLDFAALQIAGAEAIAECQPRCLAGILADEHVEQPGFGGANGGLLNADAAGFAHQSDRFLDQVADDRIDIAADIPDLGEFGGFDLEEWRTGEFRQTPRNLGLAAARRPDHQDILGADFVAQVVRQPLPAPAVAHRYRDGALGIGLADDMPVERGDDFARGQAGIGGVHGHRHVHLSSVPMVSTVS